MHLINISERLEPLFKGEVQALHRIPVTGPRVPVGVFQPLYHRNEKFQFTRRRISNQLLWDLVSNLTVCCIGGKVKHLSRLSTTSIVGIVSKESGAASIAPTKG